MQKYKCKQLK